MYKLQSHTTDTFQLEDDYELYSAKSFEGSIPIGIDVLPQDLILSNRTSGRHIFCRRAVLPIPVRLSMPVSSLNIPKITANSESVIPDLVELREKALLLDILDQKSWDIIMPPKNEFKVTLKICSIERAKPEI